MTESVTEMSLDDFNELTDQEQDRIFQLYKDWCKQHDVWAALDKDFLLWIEER